MAKWKINWIGPPAFRTKRKEKLIATRIEDFCDFNIRVIMNVVFSTENILALRSSRYPMEIILSFFGLCYKIMSCAAFIKWHSGQSSSLILPYS